MQFSKLVNLVSLVKLVKLPRTVAEWLLMEKLRGVLVIPLLEMLQVLVLIIVPHLILIIEKTNF